MTIQPFSLNIDQRVLDDLNDRLAATRWPGALDDRQNGYGIDNDIVRDWCTRWQSFDWRTKEAELNRFDHFTTAFDGIDVHFIHTRSDVAEAIPLLAMNGWPSTFAEFSGIIEPLTAPDGSDPAFHVVIPSLPGYGLSSQPTQAGWTITRIARTMAELMSRLGYERFAVHGSDMGGGVALALAGMVPDRLIAMHSLNVYWDYPPPDDASDEEREWLDVSQKWAFQEGGYAMIQASKPQTLAVGLNDSPAGMAAWILEKWQARSDGGLDVFDPDDVLANLTLYWATGTIGSSIRLYAETTRDPEKSNMVKRHEVPAGILVDKRDILPAPRAWGERWLNLVRWTESDKGGHFPALERPTLLTHEIRSTVEAALAHSGDRRATTGGVR